MSLDIKHFKKDTNLLNQYGKPFQTLKVEKNGKFTKQEIDTLLNNMYIEYKKKGWTDEQLRNITFYRVY